MDRGGAGKAAAPSAINTLQLVQVELARRVLLLLSSVLPVPPLRPRLRPFKAAPRPRARRQAAFLQERGPGGLPYQAEASVQPQLPQGPPALSTMTALARGVERRSVTWH